MAKEFVDMKYREKGISMFEFVWVLVILMTLYAISYSYLVAMKETVERTDFVGTLNRVQAQLTLKVAQWYANGQSVSRLEVEGANPIEFIDRAPMNYQGELGIANLSKCELSHWCYLRDKNYFVYRVKHTDHLQNSYEYEEFLVYRLKLTFVDDQKNRGLPTSLTLLPVYGFIWQDVKFEKTIHLTKTL